MKPLRIVKRIVGPAIIEWHDENPLQWTMSENVGEGKRTELKQHSFDLTSLLIGYDKKFLLALKDRWIDRRLQVKLRTVKTQAYCVQMVLQACQNESKRISRQTSTIQPVFERVDSNLIACLRAVQDGLPHTYLKAFKRFHKMYGHDPALFQAGLYSGDFPQGRKTFENLGNHGELRQSVLATALSRATLVHVLNVTEAAFEAGELSLGLFAYSRLLLSRAARPESFRLLRLKDLQIDEKDGKKSYFITLTIPKARTHKPPHATIRLHNEVGQILNRQRDAVATRFESLVHEQNVERRDSAENFTPFTIGDLPLFPAEPPSGRIYRRTKENLGIVNSAGTLTTYYIEPLKRLTSAKINHSALRHTIGTQLAIAGCSASTIAAVLLHATNQNAGVYVDLVFSGAIDELSSSMEEAFLEHFPVIKQFVSANDVVDPSKRIVSPSLNRERREITGECGRRQICQYSPIACYECPRFKPCYDVDHKINLERVQEEIDSARSGGLPRQADVQRYMHIANRIRIVINLCEAKREAIAAEQASGKMYE